MRSGYFGKLPARADFVIGHCPKGFLQLWEPFLVQGLAQSRLDLGEAWKEAYMTMPVWRFELQPQQRPEDAGQTQPAVAGAFMPSVDRVGREYPLTIVAGHEQAGGMPADRWHGEAEAILLGALREEAGLEGFQTAVDGLDSPAEEAGDGHPPEGVRLSAMAETADLVRSWFWCRAGSTEFVFECDGLPDASAFRWLILPERYTAGEDQKDVAGDIHGRSHPEDHRT